MNLAGSTNLPFFQSLDTTGFSAWYFSSLINGLNLAQINKTNYFKPFTVRCHLDIISADSKMSSVEKLSSRMSSRWLWWTVGHISIPVMTTLCHVRKNPNCIYREMPQVLFKNAFDIGLFYFDLCNLFFFSSKKVVASRVFLSPTF